MNPALGVELPVHASVSFPFDKHESDPIEAPKVLLSIHKLIVFPVSSSFNVSTSSNASCARLDPVASMFTKLSVTIYFLAKYVSDGLRLPRKFVFHTVPSRRLFVVPNLILDLPL
jgi:hypothetical protein